jgi:dTDP-4-dehydrorhamnose 3,5-epimerase
MDKLTIMPSKLQGAAVVKTKLFEDNRGSFNRFLCMDELKGYLQGKSIAAINFSLSHEVGTIRGLHFQNPPFAEIKMVRCVRGRVFDVMVDLRKESPTFGQWHGEFLTPQNMKMMLIPEGFAHGFQVLEKESELLYIHTAPYSKKHESGVRFDAPELGIQWPLPSLNLSERDLKLPSFSSNLYN